MWNYLVAKDLCKSVGINVQVVFDAKCKLLDILAKWHDSRILNDSGVTTLFERGYTPAGCHLLGDRGYGGKTWLLTPYLQPLPGHQSRYNMYVCNIIHVCGMLHNICKDRNINIPVDEEYDVVGEAEDDVARRAVVRAPRAVPLPQARFLSAQWRRVLEQKWWALTWMPHLWMPRRRTNTSVPSSKLLSAGVDGSVLWPAGDDGSSNGSWLSPRSLTDHYKK
ncbi:hypothetical protein GWK47_020000 [Chionoecetes opilio]|uniref:DDE Tnp4 domain-containing protein n=1 Tax=Chionoecetes opilio TaxID=41210 RepID=A0A8J4XQ14_CHIOP|nr:hypothetical protein GWK47_020000 [Chionoecetes opilio]